MGLRFRRSVKLAPGLRLNVTGSGLSVTVGPRGASINVGSRGTHLNLGIPGTGLYSRTRLAATTGKPGKAPPQPQISGTRSDQSSHLKPLIEAFVREEPDGTQTYVDSGGSKLSDFELLLAGLKKAEDLPPASSLFPSLTTLHLDTPAPDRAPSYETKSFALPEPEPPALTEITRGARFWGHGKRLEAENEESRQRYQHAVARWKADKANFELEQLVAGQQFERRLQSDCHFMQEILEGTFAGINWPRETLVSFDVRDNGASVLLDVDLPEIEDIHGSLAGRSDSDQSPKSMLAGAKGKKLRETYLRHVHSVAFRTIGEVFSCLPTVQTVTLSGYTQRVDHTTGHATDTYVLSVRVSRAQWNGINFDNLSGIDIVAAFERFDLRRKLARDGELEAIEPF